MLQKHTLRTHRPLWICGLGGMQVSYQLLTDRLAVTFAGVAFAGSPAGSTFQAELFTQNGSLPRGSMRLSWLAVSAPSALVGLSAGGGGAAPAQRDFAAQVKGC